MSITRRLDTPESRRFWREPEPPLPTSKPVRRAVAEEKREMMRRLDALICNDTLGVDHRDVLRLIASLKAEVARWERGL